MKEETHLSHSEWTRILFVQEQEAQEGDEQEEAESVLVIQS